MADFAPISNFQKPIEIILSYANHVTPFHDYDWCAFSADSEGDESCVRGWGKNPFAAIKDLNDLLELDNSKFIIKKIYGR